MKKIEKLKIILKKLERVVVAYSGGLDSVFLLKAAIDTLGKENVLAVTARSESYPHSEYLEAKRIARKLGARHVSISTKELDIKNFSANPVNRCYYCKKELFETLDLLRLKYKMCYVLDGTNYDDLKDVRYGRKAAAELGVRSPLFDAKMTKDDIRHFSKKLKLSTWDKPSLACLASRIPFGRTITSGVLKSVEKAEALIRKFGIGQVRVRAHDNIARIEVSPKDFAKITRHSSAIAKHLKRLGFTYVTLDLRGYRTGSMHE